METLNIICIGIGYIVLVSAFIATVWNSVSAIINYHENRSVRHRQQREWLSFAQASEWMGSNFPILHEVRDWATKNEYMESIDQFRSKMEKKYLAQETNQ